ncbi:MAG: type II toxin-antitoxin system VapC family toxin [Mycobacteriales bacterium]
MNYLDSSAIVKLARSETETVALRAWLAKHPQPLVTSSLARTETARALTRSEPTALGKLAAVLATFHQKPVTDVILDAAAALSEPHIRSLDAIHLVTAEAFGATLGTFIAYDRRLAAIAQQHGFLVESPGM